MIDMMALRFGPSKVDGFVKTRIGLSPSYNFPPFLGGLT